jgi:hypothetical protein
VITDIARHEKKNWERKKMSVKKRFRGMLATFFI